MAQLPILKLHDPTFLPAPVTITVGNIKGGVGKTTLATNLAVWAAIRRFAKTALIDTDAQQSAATFANMRAETLGDPLFTCVSILNAEALKVHARRIAADHALTIIDAGGRDTATLRYALLISDAVLIPLGPRAYDVWALQQMVDLIAQARAYNQRLQAFAVLSMADLRGAESRDVARMLADLNGVEFLDTPIRKRSAWFRAAADGKGVVEAKPRDNGAIEDLEALTGALFERVRASATIRA